jgi:hypothetical protein
MISKRIGKAADKDHVGMHIDTRLYSHPAKKMQQRCDVKKKAVTLKKKANTTNSG